MMAIATFAARPAFADVTAFLGANVTPSSRVVMGASASLGFGPVGFEFEYASTKEDKSNGDAPALKTGMANVIVQSPVPIWRLRPYVTAGVGVYRETISGLVAPCFPEGPCTFGREHTSFGMNLGGGVKLTLIGPLRLRLDYRVFRLGSGALFSPAHRLYAGINLGF